MHYLLMDVACIPLYSHFYTYDVIAISLRFVRQRWLCIPLRYSIVIPCIEDGFFVWRTHVWCDLHHTSCTCYSRNLAFIHFPFNDQFRKVWLFLKYGQTPSRYQRVDAGDMNWLIPGKFLASNQFLTSFADFSVVRSPAMVIHFSFHKISSKREPHQPSLGFENGWATIWY